MPRVWYNLSMQPTTRSMVSALLPRRHFHSFWKGRRCGLRLIATYLLLVKRAEQLFLLPVSFS